MTLLERRAIAKAAGKCGTCRKRIPDPGYETCVICLQSRNNSRGGAVYHVCCQSSLAHRFDCREAVVRGVAYRRRAA